MPSVPPTGPQPPMMPTQPSPGGKTISTPSSSSADAYLLDSPFAKMFTATGAAPTAEEMRGIINGILKSVIANVKKEDDKWKEAMRKLKEIIEGTDQ